MERSFSGRRIRAMVAAALALAGAAVALYHAFSWPIDALVSGRAAEVGPNTVLLYTVLSIAFIGGAILLLVGAGMLLAGYYSMAARVILAGGLASGYGLWELALAVPAALLGGTIPPEDEFSRQ
jgi:hypothetical protein